MERANDSRNRYTKAAAWRNANEFRHSLSRAPSGWLADDAVDSEPVSGAVYALTAVYNPTVVYAVAWFMKCGTLRKGRINDGPVGS